MHMVGGIWVAWNLCFVMVGTYYTSSFGKKNTKAKLMMDEQATKILACCEKN